MTGTVFRFLAALLLFLASLMVLLPATTMLLWYVVILVSEFGHFFSLASIAVLVWELARGRQAQPLTLVLAVVSTAFFLLPLVQAARIAGRLPAQLAAVFGDKARPTFPGEPIRLAKLWALTPLPKVAEMRRSCPAKDGQTLTILLYGDVTAGPRPCVLILHGGGWNTGGPDQLSNWSRRLAALGYRVASMSYRLAPKATWPAQKEDVAAVLAYLKLHAAELGIDPARFVILGRSAGGQIALAAGYALHDPAIRGVIASYAPTDMNFAYWTGKEHDLIGSRPLVRGLMGGPPASNPPLYRDASPLDWVDVTTPPTLLIHGKRDEIVWVRHSERLQDALREAGRPVFLLELPWATHGFDVTTRGPGGQLEFYAMAWFLRSTLGP